uniref:intelectin-1-like n=1 Tax=Styela clava TaxID=7725 RepID=UPI00193A118E|nr:intelectin-1-like [Styela clava]
MNFILIYVLLSVVTISSVSSQTTNATETTTEAQTTTPPPTLEDFAGCSSILKKFGEPENGLYTIVDKSGSMYRTYCDMEIDGGGWTLVASVHENNIDGKCSVGDKWSSQQGTAVPLNEGEQFWANTAIWGLVESATSDDFKCQGYFNLPAKDIMIWHVPNDTPYYDFSDKAFLKYRTNSGFLEHYGWNLYHLFKDYYPLRQGHSDDKDGPAEMIVWDKGNNETMFNNTAPNMREHTEPGFIQFRAIDRSYAAFALCPGVMIKESNLDPAYACVGSVGYAATSTYQCGDFAGWDGKGKNPKWSASKKMRESSILIFYR